MFQDLYWLRMIKKDKWFKLSLSFQLKEDLKFTSSDEYLELWGEIGKVLGIEGYVADVTIRKVEDK